MSINIAAQQPICCSCGHTAYGLALLHKKQYLCVHYHFNKVDFFHHQFSLKFFPRQSQEAFRAMPHSGAHLLCISFEGERKSTSLFLVALVNTFCSESLDHAEILRNLGKIVSPTVFIFQNCFSVVQNYSNKDNFSFKYLHFEYIYTFI